jgi:hypothetical protein
LVGGEPAAPGLTLIQHSLPGHQIAFAADQSARERRVVEVTQPAPDRLKQVALI